MFTEADALFWAYNIAWIFFMFAFIALNPYLPRWLVLIIFLLIPVFLFLGITTGLDL